MQLSIGSYSFHRLLKSGKQDMFLYIKDCKRPGATQLDPWNANLAVIYNNDAEIRQKADLSDFRLDTSELAYLEKVKLAAEEAGLPFGCIAVDGVHIYESEARLREGNRAVAYRWLEAMRSLCQIHSFQNFFF